jgi:hypothetical protein
MNPLRWDVLAVGFVLALPVFALGVRGDLSVEEVMSRLLWSLLAGWAVVALLRWAATPRGPAGTHPDVPADPTSPEDDAPHHS